MTCYKLYGLTLETKTPLVNRVSAGSGIPDLRFKIVKTSPVTDQWQKTAPSYTTQMITRDGENLLTIHRMAGYDVIHFANIADFYLWEQQIIAHVLDISNYPYIEVLFLGEVLSVWLELHGIPTLHASAVALNNETIGFISTNKGGKSVLAATMMQQGLSLLTDDILPVESGDARFYGRPGYPQMRMWPEVADFFFGADANPEFVLPWYPKHRIPVGDASFGTFCNEKQPLKVLYIPERQQTNDAISIEPVPAPDALMELIRNSFSSNFIEALGLQVPRMNFLASLVMKVPVRRLIYPSGFKNLPNVSNAILRDVESL